jgi:hypothetical protein
MLEKHVITRITEDCLWDEVAEGTKLASATSFKQKWNHQARNADHYLWYGQSRAPLFLENVKANAAIAVDVWVEHLGAERDLKYVHVWMSE